MDLSDWHLWHKRRGGRQLRGLLMDEWDPIGVRDVPEALDEYDTYVARIADSLRGGADVHQVAAMLSTTGLRGIASSQRRVRSRR